jgi:multiple sugar transport system ATP-binding protein
MPAIQLDGLTKAYKHGPLAVDHVSLDIADGEFMVLVGPSGCGKSTLMKMVAGIEEVTAGTIHIGDRDVTHLDPRKRDTAMVFQSYALYPHLSVRGNLGFGLKLRGVAKAQIAARVDEVARILGLEDLLERKPAELSGGQRQRVAMGRAIAREPAAFLMDEPLSNLDAKLRVSMRAQLTRLHERLGVTTIYVTHDQVEAMTLGQRVAVMREGRVLQMDTPQALYSAPVNLFVAAFIGSPAMHLVEAGVRDGTVSFGGYRLPVSEAPATARTIVGVRPESFEDAAFADPSLPQIEVEVQVVEDLGADAHVIFQVDAPPVDVSEVREAAGDEEAILLADRAVFTARVHPQTTARVGQTLRLAVDPTRFHFFDPATGQRLERVAAPALARA